MTCSVAIIQRESILCSICQTKQWFLPYLLFANESTLQNFADYLLVLPRAEVCPVDAVVVVVVVVAVVVVVVVV
jgi:hypothetical protein